VQISSLELTLKRIEEIKSTFNPDLTDTKDAPKFDNILTNALNESETPESSKYIYSPFNKNYKYTNLQGDIDGLIQKHAKLNDLNPSLVRAVVRAESNYNPDAVSPTGAEGLMQLMPSTAKSLGVENPFDPEQNIAGGTAYLKQLMDKFGSVQLAVAAYNAGPSAVEKYGSVPPYRETQNYVKKVMSNMVNPVQASAVKKYRQVELPDVPSVPIPENINPNQLLGVNLAPPANM
jgi:soluble lytic murein transglycosylase-like protein